MSSRKTRGLIGLAAGLAVTTASFGFAFAATQPSGDGALPLSDGNGSAHQHGGEKGHLPVEKSDNIELISKTKLKNVVPEKIADVGVLGDYAYLAAWGVQTCKYNGIHVVDISDIENPQEVAFIRAKEGSYPGEGIHPLRIDTPAFTGDIVVSNNERCNTTTGFGGLNIYDVTNPAAPTPLAEGIGDKTANGQGKKDANEIHSVFAWDAGDKAYVMMTDNEEGTDVDIMDITDPKKPFLAAEYDLDEYLGEQGIDITQDSPANLKEVFLHDMVVKEIGERQVALLSYWDAGYVAIDVTDPKDISYIGDTDYAEVDPEAAESDLTVAPEGNAHQAEFTADNQYVVATDEDFSPIALTSTSTDESGEETSLIASQGSDTKQLLPGDEISGESVYVGLACASGPTIEEGDGSQVAVVERGGCTFTEKVATIARAGGYAAVLIFNREGSDACDIPLGMSVEGDIPTFGVAPRSQGLALFGQTLDLEQCQAAVGEGSPADIAVGTTGDTLTFSSFFDGWGYVHLFEYGEDATMKPLDTYAVDEAHELEKAEGFGDLSVHEVATSRAQENLLYFAYYSAGFRVAEIEDDQIVEKGAYIDEDGNNFWGVEVFESGGTEYVATSDRDYGLWIFKYNPEGGEG